MAITYGQAEPKQQNVKRLLPPREARNRERFMLMVAPDQFVWDAETKEYLPDLMKMVISPGIGGVGNVVGGGLDTTAAVANQTRKGRIILKNGDHRLKMPDDPSPFFRAGEYRARWVAVRRADEGVYCYGWAWEGYDMLRNDVIWEADTEMRRRFARHIVEAQIIPPMSARMRMSEIDRQRKRVERLETKDTNNAAIKRRLEAAQEKLADLYMDYKKHTGKKVDRTFLGGESENEAPAGLVIEEEPEIVGMD